MPLNRGTHRLYQTKSLVQFFFNFSNQYIFQDYPKATQYISSFLSGIDALRDKTPNGVKFGRDTRSPWSSGVVPAGKALLQNRGDRCSFRCACIINSLYFFEKLFSHHFRRDTYALILVLRFSS